MASSESAAVPVGRDGPRLLADGLRLALTTFTVLPLRPGRVDRRVAGAAMTLAPAVGLLVGGALAGLAIAGRAVFPGTAGAVLVAALVVAAHALLTRGMHLDGLADTADGLGSYGGAERALAVMKAPDVGAFGVAAIVVDVLVQLAALAVSVAAGRAALALVVAAVTGRLAVSWSCTPRTPPARPEGLGALVAGTTSRRAAALTTAVVVAGAAGWGYGERGGFGAGRAAVAVVAALAVAHLARGHVVRRIGGITGDVLGALVELATAICFVVLAASPPH